MIVDEKATESITKSSLAQESAIFDSRYLC